MSVSLDVADYFRRAASRGSGAVFGGEVTPEQVARRTRAGRLV
jgi:hypothetical protein